jgi:hypothetical protein
MIMASECETLSYLMIPKGYFRDECNFKDRGGREYS